MQKIILALSALSFFITAHSQNEYSITSRIHIDGDGGWDYLTSDDSTGRLFVSHGTMVQVIDEQTRTVTATISGLNGVHGIALAHDLNKGFITSGRDSMLVVFDLKTLGIITKIKVTGANPDAVLYDPFSQKVFTFNGRSSNATVVDAKTNAIAGTIALPGKPEFSVTDGNGKIFVNIEDKSELCQLDPSAMKVVNTWPIKPGKEASGLAFDKVTHRLFIVCDNKLMIVMNSDNGKVIARLPIGEGVDGVAFDPEKKRIFCSNGDGTLTIVKEENENAFKFVETLVTQKGARTITVNKKTHYVYTPTAEFENAPQEKDGQHKRPPLKPGTFTVLEIAPAK